VDCFLVTPPLPALVLVINYVIPIFKIVYCFCSRTIFDQRFIEKEDFEVNRLYKTIWDSYPGIG
jgi:hypothetical protein